MEKRKRMKVKKKEKQKKEMKKYECKTVDQYVRKNDCSKKLEKLNEKKIN